MNCHTYTVKANNVFESDNFLRCLWSQLRYHFGNYGWNYWGHKYKNRIDFGDLDLGLSRPINVSYDYKKKGCINNIYLKFSENASIKTKFDNCVENALNYEKQIKSSLIGLPIESPEPIFDYTGDYFQIILETKNTALLQMQIDYFDDVDKKQEASFRANDLIKLLTVASTYPIYYCNNFIKNGTKIAHNPKEIDNLRIIDDFLNSHNSSSNIYHKVIDAATCYYNASKILYNNSTGLHLKISGIKDNVISYETTDFQQLIFENFQKFKIDIELSVVFFINTLEVLSLLNDADNSVCKLCNSRIYSIAKKVHDLCLKYGSEEIAGRIKKAYSVRSKIVHTGVLIEKRDALQGVVNPRMDLSQNSGLIQLLSELPENLACDTKTLFFSYIKALIDFNV